MDIDKAIELLSDSAYRGVTTFDEDYKDALRMGAKALTIIAHDRALRWDALSLQLLLGAKRRDGGD